MGEDMADGTDCVDARRRSLAPLRPRQRGHSAQQLRAAAGGPATPIRAFGPISDAVAMRTNGPRLKLRECAGSPLANAWHSAARGHSWQRGLRGRQIVAPRSIIAWVKSPGRSSGIIARTRSRSRRGWPFERFSRATTRATLVSIAAAASPTRSRPQRRTYRRRPPAVCAAARGCRKAAAMNDCAGAGDKISGAGVIAEPGPLERIASSGAAASASMLGQRATKRSNRGMTVATVVCWSKTSLSHTR